MTLSIYNVQGELVRDLYLGYQSVGAYVARDKAAHWDGRNDTGQRVASGLYFYHIRAGSFSETRRMVVLK